MLGGSTSNVNLAFLTLFKSKNSFVFFLHMLTRSEKLIIIHMKEYKEAAIMEEVY